MSTGRDIVIGDVHGCRDELHELLRTVQRRAVDRLVFTGDLVDRGPDSAGVVRDVMKLGAVCVMGNHDEWYARYHRYEARGAMNPMARHPHKLAIYARLSDAERAWLSTLPLWYRLDARTLVVHAGLAPGQPLDQQDPANFTHMRYLDKATGRRISSEQTLSGSLHAHWSEVWDGPYDVVYGHHPSQGDAVVTTAEWSKTWGIDTGCCFGNKLTAWVRSGSQIDLVSVPARAVYAKWRT